MKTLYLECNMGAAGDMLMGALYELLEDKAGFLDTMNRLILGVTVEAQAAATCGIRGTHMAVTVHDEEEHSHDVALGHGEDAVHEHIHETAHDETHHGHDHHHDHGHEHDHEHEHHHSHEHTDEHAHSHEHGHDHEHEHSHDHDHDDHHHHHHTAPADINAILDSLDVPEEVRANAKAVYGRIADAEAKAHGMPVTEIHFHEVGALDAIADVTGVCLALYLLKPDRIVVSPVHVGSGQVRCAHGVMPVPAPATANLLSGIPSYSGDIRGELCTPTGAALLAHFGQSFGPQPMMAVRQVGNGLGTKEFPAANCVRAFWGEEAAQTREVVSELCCHIDDMTAEALGFAMERLQEAGALDVSAAPILMKKGRPATALTVLCRAEDEARLAEAVLRETSTLGVRVHPCARYTLTPSLRQVETAYGPIAIKCGDGCGIHREKPEYQDVADAARKVGVPFHQVWEAALSAAREN